MIPRLREAFQNADNEHVALGHFNFSELVVLKAVVTAAQQLGVRGCGTLTALTVSLLFPNRPLGRYAIESMCPRAGFNHL
jgi:hypothetical protein